MADLEGQEASGQPVASSLQLPAHTHVRASSGPTPSFTIDSAKEDSGEDKQTNRQVTLEARKVLEQFLKRSLSHNDASPYQREQQITELDLIEEHPDAGAEGHVLRSDSYHHAAVENPYYMYGPHSSQPEPDYVYAHSLISKTNSVSSQGSYGPYSLKPFQGPGRSRSPSDKMTYSVHPPPIKPSCKVKSSKGKKKAHFDASSSSSTSTEDYEYVDNEFLSRKKKSFFRWASERLRESFRRKKEASGAGSDLESPKEELPPGGGIIKPKKKKKSKLRLSLKRSNSEKSKSSSTPNEAGAEAQAAEPKASRKEEKDKGLWDSFLRSFRKSGLKLKRKGSKERQRSRSADNLVIRPLTKEHEKLLKRYVDNRPRGERGETETDSDSHTVRSFHEVVCHRVDQSVLARPPQSPAARSRPGLEAVLDSQLHDTATCRQKMQLEGLVKFHPDTSQDFTLDYESSGVEQITQHSEGDGTLVTTYAESHEVLRVASDRKLTDTDSGGLDDTDGMPQLRRALLQSTGKPFHERTEKEKEDLYEKIAEQLAAIADHYNLDSPKSPKCSPPDICIRRSSSATTTTSTSLEPASTSTQACSQTSSSLISTQSTSQTTSTSTSSQKTTHEGQSSSESDELQGAKAPKPKSSRSHRAKRMSRECLLEQELGALLRQRGDSAAKNLPDPTPVVIELVRNASYSKFQQIVNENIGNEPGWQQLAMMFRFTQTAVQLAGMGTAAALQIKELTLKYFEDRFASWIVGQGGWESMVEDTNTELDSELD